jgi:hypothetical protein
MPEITTKPTAHRLLQTSSKDKLDAILAATRDRRDYWFIYFFLFPMVAGTTFLATYIVMAARNRDRNPSGQDPRAKPAIVVDQFSEIKRQREQRDREYFERNAKSSFVVQRLRLERLTFFSDGEWVCQPGVNILLGRNGYGKSLLLGTLASLLSQDEQYPAHLLRKGGAISLRLLRDKEELTVRRPQDYADSIGKVPILAIPDTRFLDRAEPTVGPSA